MEGEIESGFNGKVAVVTGAASGIGRSVATRLAMLGARVALVDRNGDGLADLANELGDAIAVELDVSDEAAVASALASVVSHFGTVDLLHNNAGVLDGMTPLVDSSVESLDRLWQVNGRGAFLVLREFVRILRSHNKPGAVVNTASAAGLQGTARLIGYSMTKHAVVGLTRSTAIELGPVGIRINAICPGRVDTPMVGPMDGELGDQKAVLDMRPIARMATPGEIANLVVWLLSDQASFVTGAAYAIDGGLTA